MCSVVGYIGSKYSKEFVLEGLTRLEYRGYDSAGFACLNPQDNRLLYAKAQGRLANLVALTESNPIDGYVGIGHTRWSTHGISTTENAHPHFSCDRSIAVVHNGIIENHHEIRDQLERAGHLFISQTDTEVVAHLAELLLTGQRSLEDALIHMVAQLKGAYAIILLAQQFPDSMVLIRRRSPLCIGIGDQEMFVASDVLAFAGKTKRVIFLPDETIAIVQKDTVTVYDFSGTKLSLEPQLVDVDWDMGQKNGHDHYMLKEIYEQKSVLNRTITALDDLTPNAWGQMAIPSDYMQKVSSIVLIGCGTSWHAALIAQFFFEELCGITTTVCLGSEFRSKRFFSVPNRLYVIVSQSGETADSLDALRFIKEQGALVLVLTNVASSTMVREADGAFFTYAGHEIAVASTKAFSTQVAALYWFANRIAYEQQAINSVQMDRVKADVVMAATILEDTMERYKEVIKQTFAVRYARASHAIFLGRHVTYPFAREVALKLKEISYIFALSYPAGELKHGPLALVDEHTPVFLFSHQDPIIYQKLLSNAQEVKARGGHLIVCAFEGQQELATLADCLFVLPDTTPALLGPLCMTGLMQLFVYYIALELERPIDKPRNLAKSVTVE